MTLNDKVYSWITEMGVKLERNVCGDEYFATYEGKTVLINLTDFELNKTAYRLNSSKRQTMGVLNRFDIPHVEVIDLPADYNDAYNIAIDYFNSNDIFVLRGDKGTCGKKHIYYKV